jgi:predicted amidohydrolase
MVPSAAASYDRWMTSTDPTGAIDHTDPDARSVRVRAQELAPVLGDLDGNLRTIEAAIRDAVADGVQLLVLPELATSGYYLDGPEAARAVTLPSDAPVFADWASLLPEDTVVVVGFCERDGETIHNSALVLGASGTLGVYRKVHLWDEEQTVFVAGRETQPVVETPIGRLGVLVCYDLEFPEVPRGLALRGADLLVVPTNWPLVDRPVGERAPEVVQAMAAARASAIPIVCCDRSGTEAGKPWTEGTTIIPAEGWPVGAKDARGRVDATVRIDRGATRIGPRNDVLADRRPELYGAVTAEGSSDRHR